MSASVAESCAVIQRWMSREKRLKDRCEIRVTDWCPLNTGEYTDGSLLEGAAAAVTTVVAEYLGTQTTVMDAELLGICLALESNHTSIALDSQAAITRAASLYTEPARS